MAHMIQPAKARRLTYPFVAYPDPEGGYSIAFPDLPGVTTVADDLAAIPDAVRDILDFTFEGDEEDGRLVPAPAATFPDDGVVSVFGDQAVAWDETVPLHTAQEVADELGISRRALNFAAEKAGAGRMVGKQRLYTAQDVERLRQRPPQGRPRAAD